MKEASILIEIERNIYPHGNGDRCTRWIVDTDGQADITAQGATPSQVRQNLAAKTAQHLQDSPINAQRRNLRYG